MDHANHRDAIIKLIGKPCMCHGGHGTCFSQFSSCIDAVVQQRLTLNAMDDVQRDVCISVMLHGSVRMIPVQPIGAVSDSDADDVPPHGGDVCERVSDSGSSTGRIWDTDSDDGPGLANVGLRPSSKAVSARHKSCITRAVGYSSSLCGMPVCKRALARLLGVGSGKLDMLAKGIIGTVPST
jgi:hypothetical protein